jgi:hypothetical protein
MRLARSDKSAVSSPWERRPTCYGGYFGRVETHTSTTSRSTSESLTGSGTASRAYTRGMARPTLLTDELRERIGEAQMEIDDLEDALLAAGFFEDEWDNTWELIEEMLLEPGKQIRHVQDQARKPPGQGGFLKNGKRRRVRR